jgi:hypothetical protein
MNYWSAFIELIETPFQHLPLIWGIVPLYFGLLLNEMTSSKASYRTAVQTGFSFLWAGAQWIYPYFKPHTPNGPRVEVSAMMPIHLLVTSIVILLGALALISGLSRRFPRWAKFLGYTRFANYFMIMIFPIQTHYLPWTWDRLIAIALFALPVWLVLHFGLMPMRRGK